MFKLFYPTAFRCVRIVAKSAYQLRHIRLPIHGYRRGSHWTHFREI